MGTKRSHSSPKRIPQPPGILRSHSNLYALYLKKPDSGLLEQIRKDLDRRLAPPDTVHEGIDPDEFGWRIFDLEEKKE